ncbi:hypothetical protein [Bacteriophage sp.]|nr:hypothetical protein [Bacteriophage sp.]
MNPYLSPNEHREQAHGCIIALALITGSAVLVILSSFGYSRCALSEHRARLIRRHYVSKSSGA